MRSQHPNRRRGFLGVAVGIAALISTTCTACGHSPSGASNADPAQANAPAVRVVAGDSRLPSGTATDWVTYADHVVQVTVTSSTNIDPAPSEVAAGEGVILRDLILTVDRVVWSKPKAAKEAPQSFHWTAFGWLFKGDPNDPASLTEMAGEDEPRLEVGESYLMAIEWEPARCPPGGDKMSAAWRGLGSDSVIPFSGEVLGTGELMGHHVDGHARAAALDPAAVDYSFEDAVTGKPLGALMHGLANANGHKPENYGPPPAPCP